MLRPCLRNAPPLHLLAKQLLMFKHGQVRLAPSLAYTRFDCRGPSAESSHNCTSRNLQAHTRSTVVLSPVSARAFAFKVRKFPAAAGESDDSGDETSSGPVADDEHAAETDNTLRAADLAPLAKTPKGASARIVEDSHHSIREADLPAPVWFVLLELREAGNQQ